jgi:type IV pilus assembly protein PilC
VIVFACAGVVPFMMIKVVPEFRKIFEEYDAELPGVTQVVIGAAHVCAHFWFIFAPVLLILVLFFGLLVIQFISGARWSIPLVNRLTRRLDTAVILEALALAAERNLAFAAGIDTLARWYPRGWIRRRLRAVLRDLKAGVDWTQSLARHGLIREVELSVFLAAARAGNLAWALREMAESNRRRLNYRLYMAAQVLFPLAILALGFLVMIYVVSCFLPLISLIQNLT